MADMFNYTGETTLARLFARLKAALSGYAKQSEVDELSEAIGDKIPSPDVAEVGQVIAVKAVDENGKPTEWEAVDMTSGGGSVQTDWNQTDETAADFLKNKPFGEVETGSDTVTWDGVTDGLVYVDISGNATTLLCCVCDAQINMNDLSSGFSFTVQGIGTDASNTFEFDASVVQEITAGVLLFPDMLGLSVPEGAVGVELDGIVFPEAGIYFLIQPSTQYVSSMTIHGYTGFPSTKQLDLKYVKETVFYVKEGDIENYSDSSVNYLYTDLQFNKKATRDELTMALRRGGGVIELVTDEHMPTSRYGFVRGGNTLFGIVYAEVFDTSLNTYRFYTAEVIE